MGRSGGGGERHTSARRALDVAGTCLEASLYMLSSCLHGPCGHKHSQLGGLCILQSIINTDW